MLILIDVLHSSYRPQLRSGSQCARCCTEIKRERLLFFRALTKAVWHKIEEDKVHRKGSIGTCDIDNDRKNICLGWL